MINWPIDRLNSDQNHPRERKREREKRMLSYLNYLINLPVYLLNQFDTSQITLMPSRHTKRERASNTRIPYRVRFRCEIKHNWESLKIQSPHIETQTTTVTLTTVVSLQENALSSSLTRCAYDLTIFLIANFHTNNWIAMSKLTPFNSLTHTVHESVNSAIKETPATCAHGSSIPVWTGKNRYCVKISEAHLN